MRYWDHSIHPFNFTEGQKFRASSDDLAEFRRQGEELIRSDPEYRMTSDHSITVRGNEWYDHRTGISCHKAEALARVPLSEI